MSDGGLDGFIGSTLKIKSPPLAINLLTNYVLASFSIHQVLASLLLWAPNRAISLLCFAFGYVESVEHNQMLVFQVVRPIKNRWAFLSCLQ